MKKSVLNLLRGGVFVLAAVAAFAFTQPIKSVIVYGAERNALGQVEEWHDVDLSQPTTHDCSDNISVGCLYEEKDENSTMVTPGEFTP
jgi:hypothetical protein